MLLSSLPILDTKIAYQFHFGLDFHENILFEDICKNCPFIDISCGCYNTSQENIKFCNTDRYKKAVDASVKEKPRYLNYYQKNIHRRIRYSYREFRESLVIELKDIPINTIRLTNEGVNVDSSKVKLKGQISLQKIGIGSIILWIEGYHPSNEAQWRFFRDPRLISINIESSEFNRQNWLMMDFVRFMILKCHILYSNKKIDNQDIENSEIIRSDQKLDNFLSGNFKHFSVYGAHTKVDIDNYPIFFVKYDITSDELNNEFKTRTKEVRLALCGDENWKCKKDDVIKASIIDANTSSRDSIFWIVNSEGTVKICSNQLETPNEESFIATVLETDVILTMRYFLQTISTLIFRIGTVKLSHQSLALLRHKLFTDVDNYSNIDISHKDTTKIRLKRIKDLFQINEIYDKIVDRLDLLNNRLVTTHSIALEKQQIILTLTFGFFGALNVLMKILDELDKFKTVCNILFAFSGAIIITGVLYLIIQLIHKKIKER